MSRKHFYLGIILAALIGGLVAIGGFILARENRSLDADAMTVAGERQNVRFSSYIDPKTFTVPEGLNFVYAAEVSTPAVVHIRSKFESANTAPAQNPQQYQHPFQEMFPELFGAPGQQGPRRGPGVPRGASGSGVIVSEDGYIVTNNHVIENANSIQVVMNDNRQYDAKLIGTDPNTDIAVLKIEESGLPYLKYGNSDAISVGEWVLAVGNPFDLTSTVTAGIISAKARSIGILANEKGTGIEAFIQTDAAVNPGNSGGALVNLKGELIGVNTAIASPTGSYSGYSFAVPSTLVAKIVDDLVEFGAVQRALLGVNISNLNAELAREQGIDINRGVYVTNVNEGSAASEAGIKQGDVIVKVNGKTINTVAQLQESIAKNRPGDKVNVTYYRDGKMKENTATLKNSMGTTKVVAKSEAIEVGGATLANLTPADKEKYKVDGGVKVVKVNGGNWKQSNVKEGFVITAVDNKKVNSAEELINILNRKNGQGTLIEGVYPNGEKAYYGMPW